MIKHINKTDETEYRICFHPDSAKQETMFMYHTDLSTAEKGMNYALTLDQWFEWELWIERYNYKTKEWDEVG